MRMNQFRPGTVNVAGVTTVLSHLHISIRTWQYLVFIYLTLSSSIAGGNIYRFPLQYSYHAPGREAVLERQSRAVGDNPFTSQEDNLRGKPGQGYYVAIDVGTPPQQLNVLVDTGSSNFAVAAEKDPNILRYFHRKLSTTFVQQDTTVFVPYIQGNWKGELGRDLVSIVSLPNVSVEANIACISTSKQFFINGSNWQGIMGMGYAAIARPDDSVEPFFDSLTKSGKVNNTFSMQLCGTVYTENATIAGLGGTVIIGGIDEKLYTGEMFYAPIHKEWYYEVIMTDLKVNGKSLQMDCKEYNFDKTIVDSGTTNLRLPTKVFQRAIEAIQQNTNLPGDTMLSQTFWAGEQLLCWKAGHVPWGAFPTVTVTLAESANTTFDLLISPQQYLRAVGDELDRSPDEDCYKFAVAPSKTGTVLGAVVMEGFYVVFDRANVRIGFAQSTCNAKDKAAVTSRVLPGKPYWNTLDCGYVKPPDDQSTLMTVAYIMAGICAACMIPLVLLILQWQWQRCRRNDDDLTDSSGLLHNDGGR